MRQFMFSIAMAALLGAGLLCPSAYAQKSKGGKGTGLPAETLLLYPDGQDAGTGLLPECGPVESNGLTGASEKIRESGVFFISDIGDSARIDIYLPKKPNGLMVIILPGGGYAGVALQHEGSAVAKWMVSRGITACVLAYRMPNGHQNVPLTDVHNTFRYCRSRAAEWGVSKIGIMGFSAGGHLAASASVYFSDSATRPDFSILMYPVINFGPFGHEGTITNLLGPKEQWFDESLSVKEYQQKVEAYNASRNRWSLDDKPHKNTPPTFIAHSVNDPVVPIENSIGYLLSLRKCGVPAEAHFYPEGKHGWGFYPEGDAEDAIGSWRKSLDESLANWLKLQLP